MRPPFVPVAVLALVLLSVTGCFSDDPQPATAEGEPPTMLPPVPVAISEVSALGAPALVSSPGNRIAEFMVARNPLDADHLVTAYGDYDSPGGVLNCAFSVSFDGGESWTVSDPVPDFSGPYLQFDGWIDFDEHGGVHAVCIRQAGPGATTEAWLYYFLSTDGGLTWSSPVQVLTDPPNRSTDKSIIGVGMDGRVYAAVSGLVARTDDNGTTWDVAKPVDSGFSVLNGLVEDNHGTMYMLGTQSGQVAVQRSSDGGETWNGTGVGPFIRPPGYNDQNRWVDQRPWITLPIIAHDARTDDVWVTWQTWDEAYGGYRLYLERSQDGGVTFEPTAIPDFTSPTCPDPCHITHPSIAFDGLGRLGMTVQLTNEGGHLKEVYFSASDDHGMTWTPALELSRTDGIGQAGWTNPGAFTPSPDNAVGIATGIADDPASAHNVAAGIALTTAVQELQMRWNGEYWGLAASSKGFVAMWIEHGGDGRPQLWAQIIGLA